jgi:hypothetical protein
MTSQTPSPSDFASSSEVLIHHYEDAVPDSLGRLQFVAYWLTDQEWVPNGVRAQVFNTNLAAFIDDEEIKGNQVRVVTA